MTFFNFVLYGIVLYNLLHNNYVCKYGDQRIYLFKKKSYKKTYNPFPYFISTVSYGRYIELEFYDYVNHEIF